MTTLLILTGLFLGPVLVGGVLVWLNDALAHRYGPALERWWNQ